MNPVEGTMHNELRDDLAAYALGALDEREAGSVEDHLADCEACREYVAWLRPAVDMLPASVEQLEPPESLRESLMATVYAEARDGAPSEAPEAPPAPRRGWRGFILRPATVLAAIAVLAAGGVLGYIVGDRVDEADVTTVPVQAERPGDEVLATVEFEAGEDAILRVEDAPPLERGNFYQAWVQRGEELQRSGTSFRPTGDAAYIADLQDSLEGADAVLVSQEAERKVKAPSTEIVMSAPLE